MVDRILKSLVDIQIAIGLIKEFTFGKSENDYFESEIVKSAVERQYLIIGEALNRIKKDDLDIFRKITDGNKIVGFRNVLAHGYDEIDDSVSWDIIKNKMPILSLDVDKLISSYKGI